MRYNIAGIASLSHAQRNYNKNWDLALIETERLETSEMWSLVCLDEDMKFFIQRSSEMYVSAYNSNCNEWKTAWEVDLD